MLYGDDHEILRRATRAWNRRQLRRGFIPPQPNAALSTVEADQVILANIHGELGRFAIKDGQLRFQEAA